MRAQPSRPQEQELSRTGYGHRDVQIRHQQLMKRRAAATAAGLAAGLAPTTVQGVAPSMADEAMGEEGYEEEDTNQEAALKEAARLRKEKYIERLTCSPPSPSSPPTTNPPPSPPTHSPYPAGTLRGSPAHRHGASGGCYSSGWSAAPSAYTACR